MEKFTDYLFVKLVAKPLAYVCLGVVTGYFLALTKAETKLANTELVND
jgi:hypothetical protein